MLELPPAYHFEVPAAHSQIMNKYVEMENCLFRCYHVDQQAISAIMCKFRPFLENVNEHSIIDDFIQKSHELNIQFTSNKGVDELPTDDGVIQAPKWHEILFDSPYIRILWGASMPGDEEPSHTHHWKSLMVILQGSTFEMKNPDGSIECDQWPIGVYELPAETAPIAYKNIGETEFKALRFEVKEMTKTIYKSQEASKYSKLSLLGEGTIYLSFRDLEEMIHKHPHTSSLPSLKVIDYGCGAGRSTRYLKSLGIAAVDGVDISEDMIYQAQQLDIEKNYQVISSGVVQAPDATYDLALMSFVTVAIDNRDEISKIFKELNRILKPGGQLLCLTLSESFWNPKRQWVSYKQDYPENYAPISGQKSRLFIKSINLELSDCYWKENDIIECAKEANLSLSSTHHPLGKVEDNIVWQDESQFAPYTIFSFSNL